MLELLSRARSMRCSAPHTRCRREKQRLPKTAEIVRLNRKGGPEKVIDEVEKRAPAGFSDIDAVLSYEDRRAITQGYHGTSVLRTMTPGSLNATATV